MPEQKLPDPVTQVVKEVGDVKIHTFMAPEAFLANATHIIEGPNELVVIDGQFVVPYALQFRGYADALKKPIKRLYLSHGHPDHFFGLGAAFADVDVYALPETIGFLKEQGESMRAARAKEYGPMVAERVVIPEHPVSAGTEVVDGITFEHVVHAKTEIDYHLSLKLPDLRIYAIQDLIYSGAHLYITQDMDTWASALKTILGEPFDLFLPGHGPPADKAEVQANIEYLEKARQTFDRVSDGDAFKAAMLEAFPNRTGAAILDIYVPRLYADG